MRKRVKGTMYPRFFITMYGAIDSKLHLEHYENGKVVYFDKKKDDFNAYLNEMMPELHLNLGQFSKEAEKVLSKMKMNYMELSSDPSSLRGKREVMDVKIKNHALSLELLDLKNDYLKKRNKLLDELDKEENGLQVYLIHYGKGMNLGAKKSDDVEIPRINYRTDEKFINYKKVEDDLLEKVMKGVSDNETV